MRIILYIALLISLGSCSVFRSRNKLGKTYTTKSGLKYTITRSGNGNRAEKGQKLKIHFTGELENGDLFASTLERDYPIVFQLGSGQVVKGLDEFFMLANQGAKATLEVPPSLAYKDKRVGKVEPNSTLIYHVEYLEILDPPVPFDTGNKDTLKLESGLQYIRVETTTNKQASAHRNVVVDYTGYLDNGNIFDSSVERGFPIEFTLGQGQVVAGWDEGVQRMKVGEKFRFIVPPHLAYGEKGLPPVVPSGATMIFDVELIEVR